MQHLDMCGACSAEFNDIHNKRHYSQTNSCKECAIQMHLYNSFNSCISINANEIHGFVITALQNGNIIAVKGIGGYLLLCDATNDTTINLLRARKHRPAKPFALLYADIKMAEKDIDLSSFETNALQEKAAPIVLCSPKEDPFSTINRRLIAPGLDKVGLMLAYSPLLLLIANGFGKPLIATSGNISGSPILYKDNDAVANLFEVADYVLTYDRNIVAPQDDSVIQFTSSGQRIILRRSRGLAPNYFPNPFHLKDGVVLAMGSELKSAFALLNCKNLYISQFLGDQGLIESQTSFKDTLSHLTDLVKADPEHILIDKHPDYFVSQYGRQIAFTENISLTSIQHHKAHLGAVLAENNLLKCKDRVLGFIWDGTGYGDDGQIWGGEIFLYENNEMERIVHLNYFPQLVGDKMSREPRLSALSLLQNLPYQQLLIQNDFTKKEWLYYQQLLQQPPALLTSSMGRFIDGIAAILGLRLHNSYEGEAAMQLEALARTCNSRPSGYYPVSLVNNHLDWNNFLIELIEDLQQKEDIASIAWKVFYSLVKMVEQVSNHFFIDKLAFSGGVFQNTLLVDLLMEVLSDEHELYFHQQLSPNDECIGFGQLACFSLLHKSRNKMISATDKIIAEQFQFTT
jgi:hydrogenase maturation protein HypF